MEPADGLAFIGRNPGDEDNVFIATGDSGMGMTHGTIAGHAASPTSSMGATNPWAELYDPARRSIARGARSSLRENWQRRSTVRATG